MTDEKEIKRINIDDLKFDLENPRLPKALHNCHDETEIVTWMVKNANLVELLTSISSQGFFDGEPLLVYPEDDKHIVVEGNRRLAAVKLLKNSTLSQSQRKKIQAVIDDTDRNIQTLPVIVYPKRDDIVEYLGYRHITGVQSWGALAKAKYLKQLRTVLINKTDIPEDDYPSQYRKLAKDIGTSSNYVARLLTGLKVYDQIEDNDFFDIPELDEKTINFSLLTTALSYSNIANHIGLESSKDIEIKNLNQKNLKELSEWIYKKNDAGYTRLADSRNLKNLNKVVAHDIALAKFRTGESDLEEATLLTDQPVEVFENSLDEVVKHLKIASSMIIHIEATTEKQLKKLVQIAEHNKNIHTLVKSKLDSKDDDPFALS